MLWFQKGNTSQTHQRCQLFWTASPRAPLLSVLMKAPPTRLFCDKSVTLQSPPALRSTGHQPSDSLGTR